MDINRVAENMIPKIKPPKQEQRKVNELSKRILEAGAKFSSVYFMKPMLCGSVAKGTWLSPAEFDLFMLFNKNLPRKKLEKYGMSAAEDIVKELGGSYKVAYSEHPYLRGSIPYEGENYNIDIVPCYDVQPEKIKSAVDRTPHHVRFVLANLKNPDEVRLLKKFCMARECYGADLKVRGFSGYLCELLIIKFGSFANVIKNASEWRAGTFLSLGQFSPDKFEPAPLVFPDPVDAGRNVASAVSGETFYKFVKACKEFIKNPSEDFFEKEKTKPYSIKEIADEISSRGTRWYAIKFERPDTNEDILYSQMRKFMRRIEEIAEKEGFKIFRKDFYCGTYCVAVFEMESWLLPGQVKHIGPNIFSPHAKEFLKHYRDYNVFLENNNWVVEYKRVNRTFMNFLKSLLTSDMRKRVIG